eukprot:g80526.t1
MKYPKYCISSEGSHCVFSEAGRPRSLTANRSRLHIAWMPSSRQSIVYFPSKRNGVKRALQIHHEHLCAAVSVEYHLNVEGAEAKMLLVVERTKWQSRNEKGRLITEGTGRGQIDNKAAVENRLAIVVPWKRAEWQAWGSGKNRVVRVGKWNT